MHTQLERHCIEALHAESITDLLKKMVAFSEDRGFARVSVTVIIEHSPTLKEHQYLTNASTYYIPEFEDLEAAHVDPVSQHAAIRSSPLIWDQSTYVGIGQGALWERQAPWGYRSGIVVGFHLPRGRHFLFGPDCDRPSCGTPSQVKQLTEDVVAFAAHVQAAACELFMQVDPPDRALASPTARELEALKWSMDGLTRWEVGRQMGLSERDLALRLQRVSRKLGCSSTYQAALRAIKLGLIACL